MSITPNPRSLPDLRRLDRAIAALNGARNAAAAGLLFASEDGLVALEACRRLFQSDYLETLYQEIWLEAGCPEGDFIDDRVRAIDVPVVASKREEVA